MDLQIKVKGCYKIKSSQMNINKINEFNSRILLKNNKQNLWIESSHNPKIRQRKEFKIFSLKQFKEIKINQWLLKNHNLVNKAYTRNKILLLKKV